MAEIGSMRDPVLREMIKERRTAVLPVGSLEQHGPHLPVSTDSDIAFEVSRRLAERLDSVLLPVVPYGVSAEHAPMFQLSLRETSLSTLLSDLCDSLLENGIYTVFVINGHHGNQDAMGTISRAKESTGQDIHVFSYWHFMERQFDHAGFAETSLMLAISDNVRMDLAEKGLIPDGMDKKELARLGRLASKSFPSVTKNGVWGDPTGATREAGQAMLCEIVENLQKRCQTFLT